MIKLNDFCAEEIRISNIREALCELSAVNKNIEPVQRCLYHINRQTALCEKQGFFLRLDAVSFFDEITAACQLIAALKGKFLSADLPGFPLFAAADYSILRLAFLEMLNAGFSCSDNVNVLLFAEPEYFSIRVFPVVKQIMRMSERAAAIHHAQFCFEENGERQNAARLTVPLNIKEEANGTVTCACEYLKNCFSVVRTGLKFNNFFRGGQE